MKHLAGVTWLLGWPLVCDRISINEGPAVAVAFAVWIVFFGLLMDNSDNAE